MFQLPAADPYGVLQLPTPPLGKSYSNSDIRKAYRKRALALHPDKNPHDENASLKFNQLNSVFEWLQVDQNRAELDNQLWTAERNRIRIKQADEAKRRLAEDLKRRERLHAQGLSGAHEGEQALRTRFRSVPTSAPSQFQVDEQTRQKASQAQYNREYLETLRKKRVQQAATATPTKTTAEVDADSTYLLDLSWSPHELNMETPERARNVLEVLLRDYKPWEMVRCAVGNAQIRFLSQAKAMTAAMNLTLLEESDTGFKRTGLRNEVFFCARVIKKPRIEKVVNVVDDDSPWDEDELKEAIAERKRREEMRRARLADPYCSEGEDDQPPTGYIPPSANPSNGYIPLSANRHMPPSTFVSPASVEPQASTFVPKTSSPASAPEAPRINPSLLHRLHLPTVETVDIASSSSEDEDLEAETLSLLRQAAAGEPALKRSRYT